MNLVIDLNPEGLYFDNNGVSIPTDAAKAFKWYKKGCDLGVRFSGHGIGIFY